MSSLLRLAAGMVVVCSSSCGLALAEDDAAPPPGGPRRPMRPPGMNRPGMMMMPGAVEGVLDSLNLDAAQRQQIMTKVEEIRRQSQEKMRAEWSNPENMQKMREIQEQMRAAREANDTAKLEELRGQMQESAEKRRAANQEMETQIHDAIKSELRPDQVEQFEKEWEQAKSRPPMGGMMRGQGAGELRRAAMTLDGLSPEQRTKIQSIFEEYRKARRGEEKPMGGPEEGVAELRKQIEDVLTDEQKGQLAERLENMGGRGRRGMRPMPPGMPPEGGVPPPPPDQP